jgi:hypothetical protein
VSSPRLSYSNVVATLALFIALGGGAVAASQFSGSQIKPGTVTGKQIRARSVPGKDLRPNSITGKQVRESKLGVVPVADRANLADRASSAGTAATAHTADSANTADTAATADTAGSAGDADRLGGLSAASYLDRCAAGTQAYAGVCFELASRTGTTWPAAAKICGDAGGRLPSLDELEGFRQQPGIVLAGAEHTSAYIDTNGLSAGGEFTIGLHDNGARSPGFVYGSSSANYRCVKPLSNL